MIEAVGLTKRYGAKTAVDDLSFQVRPGVVTGFLGPNGSGKSTTMRMILGLDEPTHGHVTIGGHRFRQLPNAQRQVGALLDAKAVHGGRSARNHLLCLAQMSGIPARRVDEVLDIVGLQQVAGKRSKGFSLGMGQRLGIAAALLGDPQVLLFDEPVNGLDPEGILWVRQLMRRLASEGRTVFVSSHLMSEMALTADHLIVIGRVRVMADTSVKDFISHNSADFARVRTRAGEIIQREKLAVALTEAGGRVLAEPDGALRVDGMPLPLISDLAHASGVRLWELSPHQASLEEAYMQLTQGAVDYRASADQQTGLQGGESAPQGAWVPQQPDAYGTTPDTGLGAPQPDPYNTAPAAPQPDPFGTGPSAPQSDPYNTAPAAPQPDPFGTGPAARQSDPYGTAPAAPQPDPYNTTQPDLFQPPPSPGSYASSQDTQPDPYAAPPAAPPRHAAPRQQNQRDSEDGR
jgi:ABC-2 type transport system ATP-binding protein